MAAFRPRSHRTCSATAWQRTCACLVTLAACLAVCNGLHDIPEAHNVRLEDLEAEIRVLRQQVAQLQGAASVGPDLGDVDAPGLRPFVPSTANLQRTLATRSALWPQHWSFLSAVSADSKITVSHVITDRPTGAGSGTFVVLGDAKGRIYFFTPAGHLLHEHDTGVAATVTALSSQLLRSNTSQLAVGFGEGTVLLLEVGHESVRSPDGSGIGFVTSVMSSYPEDRLQQQNATDASTADKAPIRHISFTKSSKQRNMLLVIDARGQVLLLLPPLGRILLARNLEAPPLAVNSNSDFQVVVQTPHAAVVILLHRGRSKIVRHCTGLAPLPETAGSSSSGSSSSSSSATSGGVAAGDVLVAAAFDPGRSFRVFGVTAGGELLALVVPSSQRTMNCRVVQRMPLRLPPGPVRLVASKGKLVLLHAAGVAAFNITQPLQLAGSHVVSHKWQDMWQLYDLAQYHTRPQPQQQRDQEGNGNTSDLELQNEKQQQTGAGSCDNSLLHTGAAATNSLPAVLAGNVLLLPLGETVVTAFTAADGAGHRGAGGGLGGSAAGGSGMNTDWVRMLQPFVIVMMVVVGVWQFIRASNKHRVGQRGMRGLGAGYGSGLEGLGPDDLGQLGMARGLFGGGGFSGGLDSDFGPYAGPRSNRERETRGRENTLDPYGGLGALGARRRARQVMHGRPERGAGNGSRGLQQSGGSVFSMRGNANAGAAARAGGSNRAAGGPRGVLRKSDPGTAAAAAAAHSGGRRVTFEDLSDNSGGDDVGRVPVGTQMDHLDAADVDLGAEGTPRQHDMQHDEHDADGADVMVGVELEQPGVSVAQPSPVWEGDDATELLMQQMAAVGLDEGSGEEQTHRVQ